MRKISYCPLFSLYCFLLPVALFMSSPVLCLRSPCTWSRDIIRTLGTQMTRRTSKSNRFNNQNNNFARASHFIKHFFPFLQDYDVKLPYFAF